MRALDTLRSMVKRPQRPTRGEKRAAPTLFVGEWIRALGKRPRDVVEGTSVNEGYLSQLVNRRKTNPTPAYLQEIADFLDIPVHYFYRLPPPKDVLGELAGLDPNTLSRLGKAK